MFSGIDHSVDHSAMMFSAAWTTEVATPTDLDEDQTARSSAKRRNKETRGQRVNIEKEEKGAKDRALRDFTAKTERRRERGTKRDNSTPI